MRMIPRLCSSFCFLKMFLFGCTTAAPNPPARLPPLTLPLLAVAPLILVLLLLLAELVRVNRRRDARPIPGEAPGEDFSGEIEVATPTATLRIER